MRRIQRIVAVALLCILMTGQNATAISFIDTEEHWASDAISFVAEKGLIDGTSDFTYAPDTPISRAELVTALFRMAGSPPIDGLNTASFVDVPTSASYADAVQWAVTYNVVTGVSTGIFQPEGSITREQLATVLNRFATLRGDDLPLDETRSVYAYADVSSIRPYALDAANWALKTGLLNGLPNTFFAPEGLITRAEAAVILQRYAENAGLSLPNAERSQGYSDKSTDSYRAFTTSDGPVIRTDTQFSTASGTHTLYSYVDTVGCTVEMGRVSANAPLAAHSLVQYTLPGTSGTLRWYDAAADTWHTESLASGVKPKGMYFVRVGGAESIFVTPLTYCSQDNGMIEYLPALDGTLTISKGSDSFTLTVTAADLPANVFSDFFTLRSSGLLVDWENDEDLARWENYRFTDQNRWCLDGYYYEAPSSYFPYGENYYHNLPAAYIAVKMSRDRGKAASRALGLAMLDIMRTQQNEQGFIPSRAGSTWLLDSFNIGPGYYDTRFNTDLWLACLNAADNFGVRDWLPNAVLYGDFLVSFAEENHYTFGSGAAEGWLVQDYWYPGSLPTHSSLNHHTSEAVFLYRLATASGNDTYAAIADKMVKGIEATEEQWIMPDGNLYYSYEPDGSMKEGDYPDLTYNDLRALQPLYAARHGVASLAITHLLASKLAWMKANGVVE